MTRHPALRPFLAAAALVSLAVLLKIPLFAVLALALVLSGLWRSHPRRPTSKRKSPSRRNRKGIVYHLIDPRDGAVRYVGQTVRRLETRWSEHCEEPQPSVRSWVLELRSRGLKPQAKAVLTGVPAGARLDAAEKEEIQRLVRRGAGLLNREHNVNWNGPGYRNGRYLGRG